jgi:ribosome-binding factor A
MNRKIEQISAVIERGVREVISRGFHDPRIAGLITVTSVKVTGDFAHAVINISVFPAEKEVLTLHGLQAAARFIRREVGDIVAARKLPEFVFQGDSSIKKEAAILGDLARVRDELDAKGIVVEHVNPNGPTSEDDERSDNNLDHDADHDADHNADHDSAHNRYERPSSPSEPDNNPAAGPDPSARPSPPSSGGWSKPKAPRKEDQAS